MKFIQAICLLLLFPALSLNSRQSYDGLEKKLKEVFSERSSILHQLSKTSKELDSIKGNLQSLKMMSQWPRRTCKGFWSSATNRDKISEGGDGEKNKIIKDLQQESKKIQAQLKELRYGKKDLIFKGQQLLDLEHKLTIAKEELEKTALDKESQLKALKDTVHICFSAVLHNQPSSSHRFPTSPSHLFRYASLINSSRVTFQQPHAKDISKVQRIVTSSKSPMNISEMTRGESVGVKECQMEKTAGECFQNQTAGSAPESKSLPDIQQQKGQVQSGQFDTKLSHNSKDADGESSKNTKPHEYN